MQSGIGGPEGKGGIFSQNIGCFAPCYWNYKTSWSNWANANRIKSADSSLEYFDDNRVPAILQVRFGVTYRRSPGSDFSNPPSNLWQHSDLAPRTVARNKDGKFMIRTRRDSSGGGSRYAKGSPLHPDQIAAGIPTTFKPNFRSHYPAMDPGQNDPKLRNSEAWWEDENWEYRADPVNKECTIVNLHPNPGDNPLVCSSEWENCDSRG